MSPVLATLVTNASSIQRQGLDQSRQILAYLLTAYGAGALGQTPVLASATTTNVPIAQATAAKFQGLTDEQFQDILAYSIASKINASGVSGVVAAGVVPTDGFALTALVNTAWGIPNGLVDAGPIKALIQYGMLIQVGANLTNL